MTDVLMKRRNVDRHRTGRPRAKMMIRQADMDGGWSGATTNQGMAGMGGRCQKLAQA